MDAVIMAGGEGTRLRPLTCDMPKPMARLCGRPVLEYILELLARGGTHRAALTLRYLPQSIREHFGVSFAGMELSFAVEDKPLGTAGGVKNALRGAQLSDGVIVMSGDAMCDIDIAAAVRYHRERKAAATLITAHVPDPREYGLVLSDPSGRIEGFVEKPGWAQSVTDAVNTGIYILSPQAAELIPDGEPYDFAKDLFPLMMSRGMPLYSFDADGYWCDIGDIGAYMSCQFDMLGGKCECGLPGSADGGVRCAGRMPEGAFTLIPPVFIGRDVRIGSGASIGPCAVIDDGVSVGAGAKIRNSVLLGGAYIGERCELRGALVCGGASLKKRSAMFEGSVAGPGSVIGTDASVSPGVRIWPGKRVEDAARAGANIKFGKARRGVFDDEGVTGEIGADITPEYCARLGAAACASCAGGVSRAGIAAAHDGSNAGAALAGAACAGALSSGCRLFSLGSCPQNVFRFAVGCLGAGMGIYTLTSGSRAVIKLAGADGLTLSRGEERRIESAMGTGDSPRCPADGFGAPYDMSGVRAVYFDRLLALAPAGLEGLAAQGRSPDRELRHMLSRALSALGCRECRSGEKGSIAVHVSADGARVSFSDEEGGFISEPRSLLLGCLAAFDRGGDVALPFDAPRAADELALSCGRRVLRYLSCPADSSDRAARALAAGQQWVRDGLANAVRILAYIREKDLRLCDFAQAVPEVALASRTVPLAGSPGGIMRRFSSGAGQGRERPAGEGVRLERRGGTVLLSPLKRGGGLRILAEAADMEAASELCADMEKEIRKEQST